MLPNTLKKKINRGFSAAIVCFIIVFAIQIQSGIAANPIQSVKITYIEEIPGPLFGTRILMDPAGKYAAAYYQEAGGWYNFRVFAIPNGSESQVGQIWNRTVSNTVEFSFSSRNSRLLLTDFDANLTIMYNLPSSTPLWQVSTPRVHAGQGSALNEDGSLAVVYTINPAGDNVILFNGSNGNIIWQRDYPGFFIVDTKISDLNNVFVGLVNNTVQKISSTNTTIWTQSYSTYASNIQFSRNESIVLGYNGMNYIVNINPATGAIITEKTFVSGYYGFVFNEEGNKIALLTIDGPNQKVIQVNPVDFSFGSEITGLPNSLIFTVSADLSYFAVGGDSTSKHFLLIDYTTMSIIFNRSLSATNAFFDAHYSKANNAIGVLTTSGRFYFMEIEKPKPPAPTTPPSQNNPPTNDTTPQPPPTIGEHLLELLQDPMNLVLMIGVFLIGTLIGILLLRSKIVPPLNLEKIKTSRDENKLTPSKPEEPHEKESKKEDSKKEDSKKEDSKKEDLKK